MLYLHIQMHFTILTVFYRFPPSEPPAGTVTAAVRTLPERIAVGECVVVPGQSQQLGPEKKLAISGRVSEVSTTCKVYVRGKGLCPENMALYGPSTLGS